MSALRWAGMRTSRSTLNMIEPTSGKTLATSLSLQSEMLDCIHLVLADHVGDIASPGGDMNPTGLSPLATHGTSALDSATKELPIVLLDTSIDGALPYMSHLSRMVTARV